MVGARAGDRNWQEVETDFGCALLHKLKIIGPEAAKGGYDPVVTRIAKLGKVVRKLIFVKDVVAKITCNVGV